MLSGVAVVIVVVGRVLELVSVVGLRCEFVVVEELVGEAAVEAFGFSVMVEDQASESPEPPQGRWGHLNRTGPEPTTTEPIPFAERPVTGFGPH
ncbi:hypothetical protein [Candidatus Poriferisocius sp.]|uniref:hypothetical protein n=1 Tax=Candidatus Poriferisocius sp. TaxID=3101276 RepID=UPI003B01F9D4